MALRYRPTHMETNVNDKTELNETLEDIGSTAIDVTTLDDNEPMVLMEDGSRVPQRAVAPQSETWLDADPKIVTDMLERRGTNRAQLVSWIATNLNEGSDFGVIKNKKSLWKAGAEKIAGMLGLQVSWPDLHHELNRLREGAEVIFLSCELLRGDVVQAQGAGARNISSDGGDWNKAIKMCKKSAMIDAVLNVGGLSEVFTQDLEDTDTDTAISEDAQQMLFDHAKGLFPDNYTSVLVSLARRRFHFGDGDWRKIPAFRFHDAIRSLTEKAEDGE